MTAGAPGSVGILGSGRLAHALQQSLSAHGGTVSVLSARDPDRAALLDLDLTVLAVSDDAIGPVAAALAAESAGRTGQGRAVVHCSGALDRTPLAPLAERGWRIGCWHPMQAFATTDTPIAEGITWGITADAELTATLAIRSEALGGHPLVLRDQDRARYHAAAAMASNYTDVLLFHAMRLLEDCGLEPAAAVRALLPLVRTSLDGVELAGLPDGLTGPASRGDVGTLRRHLAALDDRPDTAALYRAAGLAAHDLLVARGMDPATLASVDAALRDPQEPARKIT
ncbi:Rossmann-like and DUF2520 domain-containing protein [Raineyella fluvialis]|uniref:DUF2520 domain-containing protein n=1 Tax=Raineyella fluvialis TaxID=2662261 RepID=A0A5Q2FBH1_9ACTN|nr:Rossmann-like and DUF2520 domain-containing protein [Raineyella fluvialis]QGF24139.1 DUF2520 domain-containing protein [Raineyella fluvialis]